MRLSDLFDGLEHPPLPAGRYLCRIEHVDIHSERYRPQTWMLRFEVLEGPHAGHRFCDALVFGGQGLQRACLAWSRLKLSLFDYFNPSRLKGKTALLDVEIENHRDAEDRERSRNRVAFSGYELPPSRPSGKTP